MNGTVADVEASALPVGHYLAGNQCFSLGFELGLLLRIQAPKVDFVAWWTFALFRE